MCAHKPPTADSLSLPLIKHKPPEGFPVHEHPEESKKMAYKVEVGIGLGAALAAATAAAHAAAAAAVAAREKATADEEGLPPTFTISHLEKGREGVERGP